MTESDIIQFVNGKNYDIRVHRSARWIDQKCTPDVITIVADCIINYIEINGENASFTSKNIQFSDYTIQNVRDIFRKVDVDSISAAKEYDKFFGQPLKLFAYAGLLQERKIGRSNNYTVINREILDYIAIRERNSLTFLTHYISRVLLCSDLLGVFQEFFNEQTPSSYNHLKETFFNYTVKYTDIGSRGSNGKFECRRIFTKVINILAFNCGKCGTEGGYISQHSITYDMLMYNRNNFRDIYSEKPKNISRKDYMQEHGIEVNEAYYIYQSRKAKQRLRRYNDLYRNGVSEMAGDTELATHMHHIFPASEFPEISCYLENLIALTPNQHLNNAHPNGRTIYIDRDYQHDCLIVKTDSIRDNIENGIEKIYSFSDFIHVLVIGFSQDAFNDVDENDYSGVKAKIELEYAV